MPERQNYRSEEQPLRHPEAEIVLDENEIKINDTVYRIVKNFNDAIDVEMLRKKYDPYLDQYDFLVGDVSSGHLRLKGFYEKIGRFALDKKSITIIDYLSEYCNPGVPYFILERLEKHSFEENKIQNNFYHGNSNRGRINKYSNSQYKERRVHKTKIDHNKSYALKNNRNKHHTFIIKKREEN